MLGLPKFIHATYFFVLQSTDILYFHVFPSLQVFPYGLIKLLGGLSKCIQLHTLFVTLISGTIYGLSLNTRFMAKVGVVHEDNLELCVQSLAGENCFLAQRTSYFTCVLSEGFWKKLITFCMENCVELRGNRRVADHELLRGSHAGHGGFLLPPILKE